MRNIIFILAWINVSSCSLFENDTVLNSAWKTSVYAEQTLSDHGLADELHYYATVRDGFTTGPTRFVAYDIRTGREVWRANRRGNCHPPVLSRTLVHCSGSEIWSFDRLTGEEVWNYKDEDAHVYLGTSVSAVSDGERLFVKTSDQRAIVPYIPRDLVLRNEVLAFDAVTGDRLWTKSFVGGDWKGIRIWALSYSEAELLASLEVCVEVPSQTCLRSIGVVMALDPLTGEERWRFVDPQGSTPRAITAFENLLIYADRGTRHIIALDRHTRQVRYRIQLVEGYNVHARAPQVVDGIGYAAMGDEKVYAFDARTGRVLYNHRVDQGSFFDNLVCGPYLLGNNHVVNVVQRSNGRYLGNLLADGEAASQMAVYGNRVFLGTHKAVYAFEC